jgi:hypothetical protein
MLFRDFALYQGFQGSKSIIFVPVCEVFYFTVFIRLFYAEGFLFTIRFRIKLNCLSCAESWLK